MVAVSNYMVSISLQSIADYFTEAQRRFNLISLETGAMGIGGLEGFINSKLCYFLCFGTFFICLFLHFYSFFLFLFLFLFSFWEMGGGGSDGKLQNKRPWPNHFSMYIFGFDFYLIINQTNKL